MLKLTPLSPKGTQLPSMPYVVFLTGEREEGEYLKAVTVSICFPYNPPALQTDSTMDFISTVNTYYQMGDL